MELFKSNKLWKIILFLYLHSIDVPFLPVDGVVVRIQDHAFVRRCFHYVVDRKIQGVQHDSKGKERRMRIEQIFQGESPVCLVNYQNIWWISVLLVRELTEHLHLDDPKDHTDLVEEWHWRHFVLPYSDLYKQNHPSNSIRTNRFIYQIEEMDHGHLLWLVELFQYFH